MGEFYVIRLLALINNNIYWIFLKNSKYIYKRIIDNSVGLDTPNSRFYALRTTHSVQHELEENSSSHNTNDHTKDDDLSITEHCDK